MLERANKLWEKGKKDQAAMILISPCTKAVGPPGTPWDSAKNQVFATITEEEAIATIRILATIENPYCFKVGADTVGRWIKDKGKKIYEKAGWDEQGIAPEKHVCWEPSCVRYDTKEMLAESQYNKGATFLKWVCTKHQDRYNSDGTRKVSEETRVDPSVTGEHPALPMLPTGPVGLHAPECYCEQCLVAAAKYTTTHAIECVCVLCKKKALKTGTPGGVKWRVSSKIENGVPVRYYSGSHPVPGRDRFRFEHTVKHPGTGHATEIHRWFDVMPDLPTRAECGICHMVPREMNAVNVNSLNRHGNPRKGATVHSLYGDK